MTTKSKELEAQTPDVVADALSSRITIITGEIARLHADRAGNEEEIKRKEEELASSKGKLDKLSSLIKESDLLCPRCDAPLATRAYQTVSGYAGGREIDADIEWREYECGLVMEEGRVRQPCRGAVAD